MTDITQYLDLITSEHRDKPRFEATIDTLTSGSVDQALLLLTYPDLFDLDSATGVQLNAIGLWVGISRVIATPLTGAYFSFDDPSLGFDVGVWLGPGDSVNTPTTLDDASYRILIKAKIVANHWDGTLPTFMSLIATIFSGLGALIFVEDNQDMTMTVGVSGPLPSAVPLALLRGGYLMPKPAGVAINYYITSVDGSPIFGFDVQNSYISGFDTGAWGTAS